MSNLCNMGTLRDWIAIGTRAAMIQRPSNQGEVGLPAPCALPLRSLRSRCSAYTWLCIIHTTTTDMPVSVPCCVVQQGVVSTEMWAKELGPATSKSMADLGVADTAAAEDGSSQQPSKGTCMKICFNAYIEQSVKHSDVCLSVHPIPRLLL